MPEYNPIGRTGKTHGVKGEVKLFVDEDFEIEFEDIKVVFIEQVGRMSPFIVEYIRDGGQVLIKLEGIDNPENARMLCHKTLSIAGKHIVKKDPTKQMVGYHIIDSELGDLGPIEEIEEYPSQYMATLMINGKKVLIPLNDHFIKKRDDQAHKLHTTLPEGILTL
jgi:16S rRNA processing protein RimM